MAGDQEVVAVRRLAVLGGVDLLVGPVDADAQHADEHAAPVGDVAEPRLGDVPQVHRVGLAGMDGDGLHRCSPREGVSAIESRSLGSRYGAMSATPSDHVARAVPPAGTSRSPWPLRSASIGALIGSKQITGSSGGAKTCA